MVLTGSWMRRTKAETEQTRQALLEAAETLFWEKGVAQTSVLDIASTARLTRGAFYHHFKNKAAVFEALIVRSRFEQEDISIATLGDDAKALDTLRDHCRGLFELFIADRFRQRIFGIVMQRREALGELEPLAQQRRDEICRSSQTYERLLERAWRARRLAPNWTPDIAAITLYSAIMGLLDQWLRDPERFDVRPIGIACIDQLIDSFRRPRQ